MNRSDFAENRLLPAPKKIAHLPGSCPIPTRTSVMVADGRVVRAAERWLQSLGASKSKSDSPEILLTVIEQHGDAQHRDGYRLHIDPEGIQLTGASPAGCFHGLQTLFQLTRGKSSIPCCEITDGPDFSVRGLLHDTTRGKVPTLDTLKLLADRLAGLKINQLQLYIEHSFTFSFDPDIADEQNALSPEEICELDGYCRERFIDLVPAVATLGHMGRILSRPKYRHLAEIEPEAAWEKMSWPQRARGFTLDVLNPESHALVERIWTEILDAFSSPVVNICGDEPWDLAKGRNKGRIAPEKIGEAYIDHILRTHSICEKRDRRTQVWSDVVTHYPELFNRLPRDIAVLHWGYDDRANYEGTNRFVDAGLETLVCPGTSGWKRVLNAMDLAERNISTFAAAGKHHGASGLLNTDWGDHGHFNALACSWHGIALGAALAWRCDHITGEAFDRRFAGWLFDADESHELIPQLRRISKISETCETWRLLWQPVAQIRDDPTLPDNRSDANAADSVLQSIQILNNLAAGADRNELLAACLATQLFHEKIGLARGERVEPRIASDRVDQVAELFKQSWSHRNKASGLNDILDVFDRLRTEFAVT